MPLQMYALFTSMHLTRFEHYVSPLIIADCWSTNTTHLKSVYNARAKSRKGRDKHISSLRALFFERPRDSDSTKAAPHGSALIQSKLDFFCWFQTIGHPNVKRPSSDSSKRFGEQSRFYGLIIICQPWTGETFWTKDSKLYVDTKCNVISVIVV